MEIPTRNYHKLTTSLLARISGSTSEFKYTYSPEQLLHLIKELQEAYLHVVELDLYAVFTQGENEYYGRELIHVSESANHISLNSLGIPFEQLMSIDQAARKALREHVHQPAEIYMDETFYRSLNFKWPFDKNSVPHFDYESKMQSAMGRYYCSSFEHMLANLKRPEEDSRPT